MPESTTAMTALQDDLRRLFPASHELLLPHCLNPTGLALGLRHTDMVLEMLGAAVPAPRLRHLRIANVLLSAYYFMLDAVVDGHPPKHGNESMALAAQHERERGSTWAVLLTHLLAGALSEYLDAAGVRGEETRQRMAVLFRQYVEQNAASVMNESKIRSTTRRARREDEYASIVGRSCSVLFLCEASALLVGKESDPALLAAVSDFLYWMQMSDDLLDWREDVQTGNLTPLIQRCARGAAPNEEEIGRTLLLGGEFARHSAEVIHGLDDVEAANARLPFPGAIFHGYIGTVRQHVLEALTQVVEVKTE